MPDLQLITNGTATRAWRRLSVAQYLALEHTTRVRIYQPAKRASIEGSKKQLRLGPKDTAYLPVQIP